nr:hypothetical protein [Tanacetum cinerariifolium]
MDRETWMYNIDHFTPDYMKGLSEFMKCTKAHRKRVRGTLILCPCVRCRNIMSYDNSNTIRHHLIEHGFDTNYTCWNLHGEIPPQVDNDIIVLDFNMDENFGNDDNHRDNLDEMLHDAESPKQPGNDIDVYLRPLIDDMINLSETDVEIYDTYRKERFQLFAMIYCTINDFPSYGNLSGYGTKREKACPVCKNGTHSRWLTNCRKTIYMGHRRALHRHHPYRKKENLFDGTSEDRSMPKLMDGYATLSQVADLNIAFGKKVKAPPKRYVWNRYRPEGIIIQGHAAEEVVQFCTNYMDDVTDIGLPQPRHQDKVIGMSLSNFDADVIQIGYRLRRVLQYQGYDINGYTFYTKKQNDKSTVQNSGGTLIATTTDSSRMEIAKDSYYGFIEEIWELDYTTVVIPILKCKWVDNTRSCVKVDNDGFTCVNLSTNGYLSDPFILAKQVDQVFYIEDPLDKRWHIVLQSKRGIVSVDDVVDEDEYNKFDELPPFSIGFQYDAVLSDTIYLRSDHQEGQED